MVETAPIILGSVNARRLPAFYEKLGHSNVILAAGGGAFGHKDGPKQGAMACRQGEEAWVFWRAGKYGGVSLSDGIIAYAKTHEEIRGAFLTFPKAADQIYPGWRQQLGHTGKTSLPVPMVAPAAHKGNVCSAVDQSSRYADLSLVEKDLVKNGKHVLVGFCMVPQAGCGYLDTAARFAAEYSTGTDDQENSSAVSMRIADALVYYVDPVKEEMRIAYPCLLFDRNITDGRAMRSLLSMLSIGSNQGMGGVQEGLVVDFYLPPSFLKLLDGPSCNISNVWRTLRRSTPYVGLVDLQPRPFSEAFYAFWQGGVCLQSDRAQGHPVFCQSQEFIPAVAQAMQACILADVGIQRGAVQGCGLLLAPHGTRADPSSVGSSAGTVDLAMQNTSVHVQHGEAGLPPMGVEAQKNVTEGVGTVKDPGQGNFSAGVVASPCEGPPAEVIQAPGEGSMNVGLVSQDSIPGGLDQPDIGASLVHPGPMYEQAPGEGLGCSLAQDQHDIGTSLVQPGPMHEQAPGEGLGRTLVQIGSQEYTVSVEGGLAVYASKSLWADVIAGKPFLANLMGHSTRWMVGGCLGGARVPAWVHAHDFFEW